MIKNNMKWKSITFTYSRIVFFYPLNHWITLHLYIDSPISYSLFILLYPFSFFLTNTPFRTNFLSLWWIHCSQINRQIQFQASARRNASRSPKERNDRRLLALVSLFSFGSFTRRFTGSFTRRFTRRVIWWFVQWFAFDRHHCGRFILRIHRIQIHFIFQFLLNFTLFLEFQKTDLLFPALPTLKGFPAQLAKCLKKGWFLRCLKSGFFLPHRAAPPHDDSAAQNGRNSAEPTPKDSLSAEFPVSSTHTQTAINRGEPESWKTRTIAVRFPRTAAESPLHRYPVSPFLPQRMTIETSGTQSMGSFIMSVSRSFPAVKTPRRKVWWMGRKAVMSSTARSVAFTDKFNWWMSECSIDGKYNE